MKLQTLRGIRGFFGIVVPAAAAVLIGSQVRTSAQQAPAAARVGVLPGAVTESMFDPKLGGLKFHGANDCSNAKCHGAPMPAANGPPYYDEYSKWSGGEDPHQKGYESLGGASEKGKKGEAIYAKFKQLNPAAATAAKATESQKCTTCHALAAPKALQGPSFNIEEGVTCGSCHGPYQKWADPHSKKAGAEYWAAEQRKATGNDPKAFFAKWGFYDTKNILARADKCTSCHLSIDAQMVEAGHPQPAFELNTYSASYPGRHWRQEEGYFGVKLWAIGQAVSLRDAMQQLAERASAAKPNPAAVKQAYNQAMAHYTVFSPVFATKAAAGDPKNLDAWAAALQKAMTANNNADIAKAATNMSSWTISLIPGVTAIAPTKATTLALLNTITGQATTATTLGDLGIEQQRTAIYALYGGLATSPDKPADANAVLDLILGGLYPPADGKTPLNPATYSKTLTDIKGKLPK